MLPKPAMTENGVLVEEPPAKRVDEDALRKSRKLRTLARRIMRRRPCPRAIAGSKALGVRSLANQRRPQAQRFLVFAVGARKKELEVSSARGTFSRTPRMPAIARIWRFLTCARKARLAWRAAARRR